METELLGAAESKMQKECKVPLCKQNPLEGSWLKTALRIVTCFIFRHSIVGTGK